MRDRERERKRQRHELQEGDSRQREICFKFRTYFS